MPTFLPKSLEALSKDALAYSPISHVRPDHTLRRIHPRLNTGAANSEAAVSIEHAGAYLAPMATHIHRALSVLVNHAYWRLSKLFDPSGETTCRPKRHG